MSQFGLGAYGSGPYAYAFSVPTAPFLPVRWLVASADAIDDPTVFPRLVGQSFLQSKQPIWSTALATAQSGRERRRKLWSYPRWAFKVRYEVLRDAATTPELQRLLGFFNMHAGRYAEFSYLDPSDHTVLSQAFGTGDGITTSFQLVRSTRLGGIVFAEPVRSVLGAPAIAINGIVTTAFTVSLGVVTFTTAPAAGATLSWDGQFMFLCRFDQDEIDAAQMMGGLWSQDGLAFMSVKR